MLAQHGRTTGFGRGSRTGQSGQTAEAVPARPCPSATSEEIRPYIGRSGRGVQRALEGPADVPVRPKCGTARRDHPIPIAKGVDFQTGGPQRASLLHGEARNDRFRGREE